MMLKVTVGGKRYDLRFSYSKTYMGTDDKGKDILVPRNTMAEIFEENGVHPLASGMALLHPADANKFRYKLGRKIALKEAVENIGWSLPQRAEFWSQVMGLVRD
jgi:hypothetical protein